MIGRAVLGRYRIVRALAKGGMGVVYLARSEGASGFTKPVVVKRMLSDLMLDQTMARMFVREARIMSRLRHPGLVGVTDFGEERGDYLMVIEYVHGFHLGQWHRYVRQVRGPFSAEMVVHIVTKVLDALHYAHTLTSEDGSPMNIIHRDVSPSNVLIDVEGHVKLTDFGVARSRDHTEQTEETTIKGKMPYLAPELFRLEEPTALTDAYACAVVLHELLVGKNEFRASDMAATVSRVLEHKPTPVNHIRDDISDELSAVIQRALSKEPADRYSSAEEFAKALRETHKNSESERDKAMHDMVQKDFRDPRIATVLRSPSLAELESAWRNPPETVRSEPPTQITEIPNLSSSPPTVAPPRMRSDEKNAGAPREEPSSRRRGFPWMVVVTTTAVLGAVAMGAWFGLEYVKGRGNQEQAFVVVQPNGTATAGAGAGAAGAGGAGGGIAGQEITGQEITGQEAGEHPATSPGGAGEGNKEAQPEPMGHTSRTQGTRSARTRPARTKTAPTTENPPAATRPTSRGGLGQPFNRRRAEVISCFQQHGEGQPSSVVIGFSLAASGAVTNATIKPASVAPTPLGQCVLGVAKTTEFPPRDTGISFSIPVTIRTVSQ